MSIVKDKLEELQAKMLEHSQPIAEIKALYRFAIKDTGEQLDINIVDSNVTIGEAGQFASDAACTISLSEADMIKLLDHRLNTTMAYMTGSLKVEGKLGAALKLLEALSDYK